MNPVFIFIILFVVYLMTQNNKETYSDYHVNYPFDAYPDQFNTKNKFLHKLPYDSLTTRHYKKMYHNKTTPNCVLDESCPDTPGYYKNYPDYFEDPEKLKSYYLGYSVTGFPYNDYRFPDNKSIVYDDLNHPNHKFEYSEWYDTKPRKEAYYYGYPFYFHGKKMN